MRETLGCVSSLRPVYGSFARPEAGLGPTFRSGSVDRTTPFCYCLLARFERAYLLR